MAARRNAGISVPITAEADFSQARRDARTELAKIERDAKPIELSAELDTTEIRKAIDLAGKLDGLVASMTIDTDAGELVEAEKLARSLRNFQGRVGLSVEGKAELTDALGLAEKMDQLRKVRVEVQGRQDLERAAEIADSLDQRRTIKVDVDVDDSAVARAGDKLESELDSAGEAGADSIAGHLGDIDFADIGASGLDQLTGAIGAAGPWGAVAAGVGALFADDFLEGFSNGWRSGRVDVIRQIRTTLTDDELAVSGEVAGDLYRRGLGESLADLKDVTALIIDELKDVDEAADGAFNLEEATRQALALSEVFEVDLADSVAAVNKLITSGLVDSSEEGFNVLFDLADLTGAQFAEALEVVTEFSTSLRSLGIDGAQGIDLIGQAIELQLFEQIDQAGEVFSEFAEIIRTGGAADALAEIQLSATEMQDALANGQGDEAMAIIADRLLALPDPARRAALAVELFGSNMSLVSDPDIALELFAQADGMREVGNGATEAADKLEAANGNLVAFQRGVSEGASSLAGGLNDALGVVAEGLVHFANKMSGGELAASQLVKTVGDGPPKMAELADGTESLGESMDGAAQSADDLEAELRGIFDFSADQLFRDMAEQGDRLAESLKNGGAAAINAAGGIDISTEAGRNLQAQLEDINGVMIDAEVAYANQEITAQQLADVHVGLRDQLAAAGRAAGLTSTQVQTLTDYYLGVPGDVSTDFTANTSTAIGNVTALQQAIANIKNKSVTITASVSGPVGISASGILRRARGGWTDGLTLVGEEGPELIDVQGRAFVHTAQETRDILSNRGGDLPAGGAPSPVSAGTRPRAFIENATIMVAPGVDVWQQALLAEKVYAVLAG